MVTLLQGQEKSKSWVFCNCALSLGYDMGPGVQFKVEGPRNVKCKNTIRNLQKLSAQVIVCKLQIHCDIKKLKTFLG